MKIPFSTSHQYDQGLGHFGPRCFDQVHRRSDSSDAQILAQFDPLGPSIDRLADGFETIDTDF
jgi:hypothetical protein